jgi:hypothetical protein
MGLIKIYNVYLDMFQCNSYLKKYKEECLGHFSKESIQVRGSLEVFVTSLFLERWDGVMWTGLVWLRIGTGGELL